MKKIKKQILSALEYYNQNPTTSLTSISKIFKVDRHTLSDYLKKDFSLENLFDSQKKKENDYVYYFSDEELEIIRYYSENSNKPFKELKEKYPQAPDIRALRNWMDILGKEYVSGKQTKYSYDKNKFSEIKTEEDAYWLGFITADGCIVNNRILQIKLAEKDKKHLEKFAKYLNLKEEEITQIIKNEFGGSYKKNNPVCCIKICSKDIVNNLLDKGIFPRKSGKEIPYICENKILEKAYIRGLLDGDGYLRETQYGLGLVGSYEICKYVYNFINNNIADISNNKIHEHGIIWRLSLSGRYQSSKILQFFYQNSNISLDRKQKIFEEKYNI